MYFIRSTPWFYSILGIVSCILLNIICCIIVAILADLHSQNWIDISLFELVFTCIEAHILVHNFSISYLYISIIILLLFITIKADPNFKCSTL